MPGRLAERHASARGQGQEGHGQTARALAGLRRSMSAYHPRGSPLGPKALVVFRSGHGVSMTAWGTRFGVRARAELQGIQGVATDDATTPAPVGHASGRAGDARGPGRKKPGPTVGAGTLRSARPARGWRGRAGGGSRPPDRAGSLAWPPGLARSRARSPGRCRRRCVPPSHGSCATPRPRAVSATLVSHDRGSGAARAAPAWSPSRQRGWTATGRSWPVSGSRGTWLSCSHSV
jgi:hypothetical protein